MLAAPLGGRQHEPLAAVARVKSSVLKYESIQWIRGGLTTLRSWFDRLSEESGVPRRGHRPEAPGSSESSGLPNPRTPRTDGDRLSARGGLTLRCAAVEETTRQRLGQPKGRVQGWPWPSAGRPAKGVVLTASSEDPDPVGHKHQEQHSQQDHHDDHSRRHEGPPSSCRHGARTGDRPPRPEFKRPKGHHHITRS